MKQAFHRLLEALDPDPEKAETRYHRLRFRLVRLFGWRGARFPEDLADETLERVAEKLGDGVDIHGEDPYPYISAVAQRIYLELLREEKRERRALDELRHNRPRALVPDPIPDDDRRLFCLRRCLEELSTEDREMLLDYQRGEGRERIENRRKLAARQGCGLNALRIRVHRLRSKLEICVTRCMNERE